MNVPTDPSAIDDSPKLFRALLIASTFGYIIMFFHIYFVSPHLQDALSWHGYAAILTLPRTIPWLLLPLWIVSAIGMWFFIKSGRWLYTVLVLSDVLLMLVSGVSVQTGLGAFFEAITCLSDGALLVMAYSGPLKERFN